jgi:hypothetical protein
MARYFSFVKYTQKGIENIKESPMRKLSALLLCIGLVFLLPVTAMCATEQEKQVTIDNGLAWLASVQQADGSWTYMSGDGILAATGSAALAFIEEGYLPGDDVIIDGTNYGDVVGEACQYIFDRATVEANFGPEPAYGYPYPRYAEDYNFDGDFTNDGGNDEAIYFDPGVLQRTVYTTGIIAPVVHALGQALGKDTVVGMGSPAISGKTYAQAMQDIVDWFCFAQVEPNMGNWRGGWRYTANYPSSDNSTAQWGALPLLYVTSWGLGVPQYVKDELELWINYIQNPNGGSGYSNPGEYVNVSKTGGLLLELAVIGAPVGDFRVQNALAFINSRWNNYPSGTWYGNLNHPYAMWAVYKGLEVYGFTQEFGPGIGENFLVGFGMPSAPGGVTIGQDWDPKTSLPGDWYSDYCDFLVGIQNADGSWAGYSYWTGPLAVGWYINILNAIEVFNDPPVCTIDPPGPLSVLAGFPVAFTVTGTDPNPEDQVTLTTGGLPVGAAMVPVLPLTGPASGVSSAFAWTPTAAQRGLYTISYSATDLAGKYDEAEIEIEVLNNPPICREASPSISEIWPPNHKMVDIDILGVTDPDGDPVTITITGIYQDEPLDTAGDGSFVPDGNGVGTSKAQVRAERSGTKKVPGDGRVYHIAFTAVDDQGGECAGEVTVCVPHDQGMGSVCVDGGPLYDSLTR